MIGRPASTNERPLALLLLALLAILPACGGPVLVMPGGALSGEVKPVPPSFAFARDVGTIQLETHPQDPYSVNITAAVVDDALYASAGGNLSTWAANVEADARVRVRIQGDVYEMRAVRVTNAAEMQAFAGEWTKNPWARDPTGFEEAWVYRMEAR